MLLTFQAIGQLDTLEMHYYSSEYKFRRHVDLRMDDPIQRYIYTEGPNKGQEIDTATIAKIQIYMSNPDIRECSPCWKKTFDQNGLNYEGEYITDCCVGLFINYHSNGSVSESGQYFSLEDIIENEDNACRPTGIWFYYDEQGNLIREVNYSILYDDE
ncbi:MAG: hypothetical protein ACJA0U_000257 [Salibacteraceae bacterium]|jgi:hypothetical protein